MSSYPLRGMEQLSQLEPYHRDFRIRKSISFLPLSPPPQPAPLHSANPSINFYMVAMMITVPLHISFRRL